MRSRILWLLIASIYACAPITNAEITHPRVKWAFQTEGPIRGAAAVDGENIYFGSADGFVYAVHKDDGTLRWRFDTGAPIAGAPAVSGSTVVVNGRADTAYALDARDGSVRWAFQMQPTAVTTLEWSYFTAPPVIDGIQVLIPSGDGHLYALDLATGKKRWIFRTQDSLRAAPLVADGIAYQPSGDDHVYALSLDDGELLWRFATAGVDYDLSKGFIRSDIFTRPVLQNELLVFGSRDGNVYALDRGGQRKWSFAYGSTWAMSTAVHQGTVLVGWSTNNKINALDLETGMQLWEFDAGSHTYTTALILGESAYFGSANGSIYRLGAKDGSLQWRYSVGSDIYSSMIHDEGTLYFGTDDGRLLALTESTAERHKAIYLPAHVPENINGFVIDTKLTPYFVERGYTRVDSANALQDWLAARVNTNAPSVIVFAFAQIPPQVIGSDPKRGLLRAYLEAGGKVVWPWGLPNKDTFDETGKFLAHDPSVAQRLLDIEFMEHEDSGNYFSRPTQTGRNWGMPAWLKTCFASVKPGNDLTVLATDEFGRTSAFVKRFHSREGSGWVSYGPKGFGAPITAAELATLERVASYTID